MQIHIRIYFTIYIKSCVYTQDMYVYLHLYWCTNYARYFDLINCSRWQQRLMRRFNDANYNHKNNHRKNLNDAKLRDFPAACRTSYTCHASARLTKFSAIFVGRFSRHTNVPPSKETGQAQRCHDNIPVCSLACFMSSGKNSRSILEAGIANTNSKKRTSQACLGSFRSVSFLSVFHLTIETIV